MLAYIIFLVLTLCANVFWKWDGLDRIAMAATFAGCFFILPIYLVGEVILTTIVLIDLKLSQKV